MVIKYELNSTHKRWRDALLLLLWTIQQYQSLCCQLFTLRMMFNNTKLIQMFSKICVFEEKGLVENSKLVRTKIIVTVSKYIHILIISQFLACSRNNGVSNFFFVCLFLPRNTGYHLTYSTKNHHQNYNETRGQTSALE